MGRRGGGHKVGESSWWFHPDSGGTEGYAGYDETGDGLAAKCGQCLHEWQRELWCESEAVVDALYAFGRRTLFVCERRCVRGGNGETIFGVGMHGWVLRDV